VPNRIRLAAAAAAAVAVLGIAFGGGWLARGELEYPNCPTEDSCSIDYRDGAWHIEEDRP